MEAIDGPTFSRRKLLVMTGGLGAVLVSPVLRPSPALALLAPDRIAAPGAALLTLARFTPLVGSTFGVVSGRVQTVRATLEEATARAPRPADRPGLSGESFSLIFAANGRKALGDGTYTVVHPALGTFPLFLVAVDRGRLAQRYQAVVDRRTEQR